MRHSERGERSHQEGMMRAMSENDVSALYDRLITGWNDHDGHVMAEPFAEDGVVIGFDGV
jgi:hypothetical protein